MKFVRPLLVAGFAAVLALQPTSANADTVGHGDASGDVRSLTLDSDFDPDNPSAAEPNRAIGDVTRVRVTHATNTVRVQMRYRALNRVGFGHQHQFQFVTPSRQRYVFVDAAPGRWGGKATMRTLRGTKVSCRVSHKIDYVNDTVLVVVPRSCLGRPNVVKVGSGTLTGYGSKIFFDDARRVGGELNQRFAFSPWVRR